MIYYAYDTYSCARNYLQAKKKNKQKTLVISLFKKVIEMALIYFKKY